MNRRIKSQCGAAIGLLVFFLIVVGSEDAWRQDTSMPGPTFEVESIGEDGRVQFELEETRTRVAKLHAENEEAKERIAIATAKLDQAVLSVVESEERHSAIVEGIAALTVTTGGEEAVDLGPSDGLLHYSMPTTLTFVFDNAVGDKLTLSEAGNWWEWSNAEGEIVYAGPGRRAPGIFVATLDNSGNWGAPFTVTMPTKAEMNAWFSAQEPK